MLSHHNGAYQAKQAQIRRIFAPTPTYGRLSSILQNSLTNFLFLLKSQDAQAHLVAFCLLLHSSPSHLFTLLYSLKKRRKGFFGFGNSKNKIRTLYYLTHRTDFYSFVKKSNKFYQPQQK